MSNSTDTASFTISIPQKTIREYFDGLAKVEAAKRGPSIDWSGLLSALAMVSPLLLKGASVPSLSSMASAFGVPVDSYDSDEESDETFYGSGLVDTDHVQSSLSNCDIDISRGKVGDQVKTIVEFVGAHGASSKEGLNQLISALTFIRDNEDQIKQQAEACCPAGVCATGACADVSSGAKGVCARPLTQAKGKEPSSASTAEDNFSPDLAKKTKKVVKKPVYQESESSDAATATTTATDLASAMLSNMGIKMEGDQAAALKDLLGGLSAGLLGNLTMGATGSPVKTPTPLAEKKPEVSSKAADKTETAKVDKAD